MAIRGGCDVNKLLFKLAFLPPLRSSGPWHSCSDRIIFNIFLRAPAESRRVTEKPVRVFPPFILPSLRNESGLYNTFLSLQFCQKFRGSILTCQFSADILCASHSRTDLLPYAGPELAEGMHARGMYFSNKDQKTHSKGLSFEGREGRWPKTLCISLLSPTSQIVLKQTTKGTFREKE